MKLFRDLLIVLLAVFAVACANDQPGNQNLGPTPAPINPNAITPAPSATPGAATATTVQHYICPNNCANSGGPNAGTCPVCGTAYMHNAAYHNQPGMNNNTPTTPNPATSPTPPDAPNAAGVYHYTCSNGCAGGAGSAKPCATCGAMLAHNAAYHNTQPGATGTNVTPTTGAKSPLYINQN